jgi:hypothetical protein
MRSPSHPSTLPPIMLREPAWNIWIAESSQRFHELRRAGCEALRPGYAWLVST